MIVICVISFKLKSLKRGPTHQNASIETDIDSANETCSLKSQDSLPRPYALKRNLVMCRYITLIACVLIFFSVP
jgi:hypothetical protein